MKTRKVMENKLNELNIFALRDLARRMGVKSPTSRKKEELIKCIVDIKSGQSQPIVNKTKQGRPPKMFGYDFADVFSFQNSNKITFNQPVEEFNNEDVLILVGCLELVNNNSAILWINKNLKNENYFISSDVLNGIDVKTGDRAVVEMAVVDNQKIAKSILSINDCPIGQMKARKTFESILHIESNNSLKFNDTQYDELNLKKAENVYCYGVDNKENTIKALNMLRACKCDNKLYVNISLTEKNMWLLNELKNTELFIAQLTDKIDNVRRIVALAIERAKRLFEIGEDVVLVIDDMLSISGIDNENFNFVKTFASLTKQAKKGSITLISIMPNESIIQIEKLADKRLKF